MLAKAKNSDQAAYIGNQTGGRVAFFLYTDDFWRDYAAMQEAGVDFIGEPREEEYGYVIVFRDLYGNKWDFVQRRCPMKIKTVDENTTAGRAHD